VFTEPAEKGYGSDGDFYLPYYDPELEPDEFRYTDEVYGYQNITHFGDIRIRSNAELVEPARVRQIGMKFEPLLDWRGWPDINGFFASGEGDDEYGEGSLFISIQISVRKQPGEAFIKLLPPNNVCYLYAKVKSRIMQAHTYPPPRVMELNEDYPRGTIFLIETGLNYWIKARGSDADASVWYNLRAKPVMNIAACSWEWPESVTVSIPEDIG
jgi:hypothetical protein